MTTTRRYRFLSKFQNGELYALCGYEKESKKDMALLTVYYLFPLSSLLLLLFYYYYYFIIIIIIIIITCYDHHHKYFGAIRSYPKFRENNLKTWEN